MAAVSASAKAAAALHLLTFNVAGIPLIHPDVGRRMDAIAAEIKSGGYDVVALQEAWFDRDAQRVARAAGLPYLTRLPSPLPMGTGLAVLSRWPVADAKQVHFTSRPGALRPLTGEGVARKGALLARIRTPKGALDVWDVHLIADYPGLRYYTLRLTQVFELAEAVAAESRRRPFVLMGDLNAARDKPEYRVLVDLLGLEDACVRDGGDECEPEEEGGKPRIDHVLLPASAHPAARARLAFAEPIPGTNMRYSDHDAVAATAQWSVLRLRMDYDKRRRLEALALVESAIDRLIGELRERRARFSWVPVVGFAVERRCDRQLRQLEAVKVRVQTARALTVEGRWPLAQ